MNKLTHGDKASWSAVIWNALQGYRETCLESEENYEEWDEICTAMAWIEEELGVTKDDTITL